MYVYYAIQFTMAAFIVLGVLDHLFFNRFGIGDEFKKGICAAGPLLFCMSGYLALAPVASRLLSPLLIGISQQTGFDPSTLAGLLFAIDSGGAPLSMQLCKTEEIGLYNGYINASTMGTTVMYTIGLAISHLHPDQQKSAVYGIVCGLITLPLGSLLGSATAGFSISSVLYNTLPLLGFSLLLLLLLLFAQSIMISIIIGFGKFMTTLSILFLAADIIQALTGYALIPGMEPMENIYPIIGGIAIFLGGAYPLMAIAQRVFHNQLSRAGRALNMNKEAVEGLVLSTLNILASCPLLTKMNPTGILINLAFWTSASCVFGDHLAFTSQQAPQLLLPLLCAKLSGGILACMLAIFLCRKKILPELQ